MLIQEKQYQHTKLKLKQDFIFNYKEFQYFDCLVMIQNSAVESKI